MSSLFKRTLPIFAFTPNADHTTYAGCAVTFSAGSVAICSTTLGIGALGVILDGETTSGKDSIVPFDACPGSVRVKLSSAGAGCTVGTYLSITSSGTFTPAVATDRVCARAMEAGVANELVEAVLFRPTTL